MKIIITLDNDNKSITFDDEFLNTSQDEFYSSLYDVISMLKTIYQDQYTIDGET